MTTTPSASVTERQAAEDLLAALPGKRPKTLGGDKGYDTQGFVAQCRALKITPHVAQNTKRPDGSAMDGRTTTHKSYRISQGKRKLIEMTFGWVKHYCGLCRMMYRGLDRVTMA